MADAIRLAAGGWTVAAVLMGAAWIWHRRIGNAGVVDVGWTACVVSLSALYAGAGPGYPQRRALLAAMVAIWGVRLGAYLLRDRVLGRPEDPRYADLRARESWAARGAFFPFFQAQALLAVIFALPSLIAAFNRVPRLLPLEWAAAALWIVAISGETMADRQLERFKARDGSRGRTCRDGLWRYSRHPNYFFEWLVWVAYALFAFASPGGAAALLCPAIMLYLLFRVTGIPATEAQALRSRDDYRHYQATTSAFVPWPPRRTP